MMNVLLIAGILLCIWMLWWIFFKPYTLEELLLLDQIDAAVEERSLAAFAKQAKTKDDVDKLWEYIFRYSSETTRANTFIQFHYLLWLTFNLDRENFDLAKMAAQGCTGLPFEEVMFPAPTFVR